MQLDKKALSFYTADRFYFFFILLKTFKFLKI